MAPNLFSLPSYAIILMIGLIITRLIFLFLSHRKVTAKLVLTVIWLVIMAYIGHFGLLLPRMIHHSAKLNAQSRFEDAASDIFPETFSVPIEVGNVSAAEYHTIAMSYFIFESRTYSLVCSYSETEYEKAMVLLEERYSFRTEPMGTGSFDDDDMEIMTDPYSIIGNDRFRILVPEDGDDYPFYKECLLIMNNDVEHKIAYIVFSDFDLDMADSLEELICDYFGWAYIRW